MNTLTPTQQYVINYAYGTMPKPNNLEQQDAYAYQFFQDHDKAFVKWYKESPDNEVVGFIISNHMLEMQDHHLWTVVHHVQQLLMAGVSVIEVFKVMLQFTTRRTGKIELTSEEMSDYLDQFHTALKQLTNDPNQTPAG